MNRYGKIWGYEVKTSRDPLHDTCLSASCTGAFTTRNEFCLSNLQTSDNNNEVYDARAVRVKFLSNESRCQKPSLSMISTGCIPRTFYERVNIKSSDETPTMLL
jgi:hypothetical protein